MNSSMLSILTDECVPSDLVTALKECGFDVKTAIEVGLQGKSDDKVFEYILKHKRSLVTLDKGFGDIFRFEIKNTHGVVIIYIKNMTKSEVVNIPVSFLSELKVNDLKGRLIIIAKKRMRIIQRGI